LKKKKRKSSLLVYGLIGGTLMFLLAGITELSRARKIDQWPRTDAKVTAFSTSIPAGRSRVQEYSLDVDYTVNAHPFHARKQAALGSQDRSTVTNLHEGAIVSVAYNPANPAEAKIYAGNIGSKYPFLFFMAAVCGGCALFSWQRLKARANV